MIGPEEEDKLCIIRRLENGDLHKPPSSPHNRYHCFPVSEPQVCIILQFFLWMTFRIDDSLTVVKWI